MTLTLTPEQEAALTSSVRSGQFASQEEAVDAAFASLVKRPRNLDVDFEKLKAARTQTLVELFRDSPFAGADIDFPRDPAPMRDVEF